MNFDKAVQGALDTLKLGKDFKKKNELPFTYTDFFAEKSSVLETLGLSWRQRAGCILVCLVLSFFCFTKALMSTLSFLGSPESVVFYYALCGFFSLIALGFFSGFKTVCKNAFSKEMVVYTTVLLANSILLTISSKSWNYFIRMFISVVELIGFFLFSYTYFALKLKMGMRGISAFSMF
ncbi:hypothetical protein NEHOM01_1157 [Nematocida homosporus]|uniref:uncharacterized protein n=1 Tax=Nematocida homosporus TaxID=1912981 RepID=UPI0022212864|nr:uncharacterized protein NEHOM01_1157 [Nematocida homosporus]KAI5185907.1 hypothetical protein NEHOM01_1157 [Nematocida homosporus]